MSYLFKIKMKNMTKMHRYILFIKQLNYKPTFHNEAMSIKMLKNISNKIFKLRWLAVFLQLIIVSLTFDGVAKEQEKGIVDPYNNNSNITFNQIMEKPIMRETFLQLQRRILLEPVDALVHSFIESSPEVKHLSLMLAENFRTELNTYIINLELSHTFIPVEPLTQNSKSPLTKKYSRIQRILGDIARDFGYSAEAIKNRLFYIANGNGQVNAFTVSPFQDAIVIVANEELIDKMSDLELRAVLGHEFGHIRAGHVVNGILLNVLMNMSLRYFNSQENMSESIMESGAHNHFVQYLNKMRINKGAELKISLREIEAYVYQNREVLVPKFINLCKAILAISPGYSKEAQYFKDLYSLRENGSTVSIDIKKMQNLLQLVIGVISRSQESSSDRFASSQSHSENIATSMLKLAGVSTEANKEELRAILESTVNRAKNIVSHLSPEDLRFFNESSHPEKSLRVLSIIKFPRVPDIYFANPFMKLLLVENEVMNKVKILEAYIQGQKIRFEEINVETKKSETSSGNDKSEELKIAFNARIVQLENITKELQLELDALRQSIIAKIISIDGTSEIKEMIKTPKVPTNPRFDNLLQFTSFNKLNIIQSLEEVEKRLSFLSSDKGNLNPQEKERSLAELNNKKQLLIDGLNNFSFELLSLLENHYKLLHKKKKNGFFKQRLQKLEVIKSVILDSNSFKGQVKANGALGVNAQQLSQLLELNSNVSAKTGRSKMPSFQSFMFPNSFNSSAPRCKELFSPN